MRPAELRVYTKKDTLSGQGLDDIDMTLHPSRFLPISYPDIASAREQLDAPADANYVMWTFGNADLESVFASLSDGDILVLPERPEPYVIDSSNGFMANGVSSVHITNANGVKVEGSDVPIVQDPRNWFTMCRARRGILGLGPGAVIEPSDSGFTRPLQAASPFRMRTSGTINQFLVGAQEAMIGCGDPHPWFGNFTIRGRDFGHVAYNGIQPSDASTVTYKRIHSDGGWRGYGAVPNIETGAMTATRGTYRIESCTLMPSDPAKASSPFMVNSSPGGLMRDLMIGRHESGMLTIWNSTGIHVLNNVHTTSVRGINLESNKIGFEMHWTGGSMTLITKDGAPSLHADITPHYDSIEERGSQVARWIDVETNLDVGPGAPTRLCFRVPRDAIGTLVQKMSDATWVNGGVNIPVLYADNSTWINDL